MSEEVETENRASANLTFSQLANLLMRYWENKKIVALALWIDEMKFVNDEELADNGFVLHHINELCAASQTVRISLLIDYIINFKRVPEKFNFFADIESDLSEATTI